MRNPIWRVKSHTKPECMKITRHNGNFKTGHDHWSGLTGIELAVGKSDDSIILRYEYYVTRKNRPEKYSIPDDGTDCKIVENDRDLQWYDFSSV